MTKEGGVGPIVESAFVAADHETVYAAFTDGIGEWWPVGTHSVTGVAVEGLHLEPHAGGLLVEVWADGTRAPWGQVITVVPGSLLELAWNPGGGPRPATRVEVAFEPIAGGTQVRVTHSGWEALGEEARMDYVAGWPFVLDRLALHVSPPMPRG
ncbi:MAG: SRPBCC domain-containing protein [Candidatus Nanopelagicales bacterium]